MFIDEDGGAIPGGIVDTVYGVKCRPVHFNDGFVRCASAAVRECAESSDPTTILDVDQVDITGGLKARRFRGQDGSTMFLPSFVDVDHDNTVVSFARSLAEIGTGPNPLVPRFADGLTAYASGPICPTPGHQDMFGVDGCRVTDETRYLRVDQGSLAAPRIFRTAPEDALAYSCLCLEGCVVTSEVRHVLRAVEEVPLDNWKTAMRVRVGTGRYRYEAWEVGCAVVPEVNLSESFPYPSLFDSALADQPCEMALAEDGEMRCLPSPLVTNAGVAGVAYADAQCTQRIGVMLNPTSTPRYALELLQLSGPTVGPTRVWQVTGRLTTSEPFFSLIAGGPPFLCRPFSDPTGWTTWTLGEVVSPSTFGMLRVELR